MRQCTRWHDIAAVPVNLDGNVHDVTSAIDSLLLTEDVAKEYDIGPGDDVFMIGRFMDHDGGKTNEPAARFGHVSTTPTSIKQPTKSMLESYIIDVHSRTGYSGSPVFVYRTITSNLNNLFTSTSDKFRKPKVAQLLYILGVMWGYFPELWEITGKKKTRRSAAKGLPVIGQYVEGMSGMSCVVPSMGNTGDFESRQSNSFHRKRRTKTPKQRRVDASSIIMEECWLCHRVTKAQPCSRCDFKLSHYPPPGSGAVEFPPMRYNHSLTVGLVTFPFSFYNCL
jgi:hypothetical protein